MQHSNIIVIIIVRQLCYIYRDDANGWHMPVVATMPGHPSPPTLSVDALW